MAGIIDLPAWATVDPDNPRRIIVDTAKAMAEWLGRLGHIGGERCQYDIECAYQCVKMDVQSAMGIEGLEIKMIRAPEFALKDHPDPHRYTTTEKGPDGEEREVEYTGIWFADRGGVFEPDEYKKKEKPGVPMQSGRQRYQAIRGFLPLARLPD